MKLIEACEFIVDCPHSTAPDEGEGFPLIRTPNVGRGRLKLEGVQRVSEEVYKERTMRGVPVAGDLIFAREAPAGNVALVMPGEKVCLGQRTVQIRPNKSIVDPNFLTYFLLAPKQQYGLLGTANGSTVDHVNISSIRNLEITLPSMEAQKKKASVLSAYDDLIECNFKQIRLLEETVQRLFRKWFIDFKFPGYERTSFTDGLPVGWRRCLMKDAISFDPKVNLDKYRIKQFVPMSALSTTSMVLDKREFTETESNSGSKFQNGDTLLARITPCLENGKTAFVQGISSEEGAVGSTEFIVMRSKALNPYMVYLLARTGEFRQAAINNMTGSDGRQRTKSERLKMLPTTIPSPKVMMEFENIVGPIFNEIYTLNLTCLTLNDARECLLPELMNDES